MEGEKSEELIGNSRLESDGSHEFVDNECEESECISQIHLLADKTLIEGRAFKAVRDNDIPMLSAILFSGYEIDAGNENWNANEGGHGENTYYDIQDRFRMVRYVRIKNYTPLHLAVVHSNLKVIKYLLSKGANVNVVDVNNISPLYLAAAVQRADVAQLLIRAGAIVDHQSASGRTPLLQAVTNNNYTLAQQLLKAGADPNLADMKGTTPLLMAVPSNRKPEEKIIQMLIDAGATVDLPNKLGATALLLAVGFGKLDAADILLDAGAEINVRDKAGQGVMHFASGTTTALFLLHRGATSDWPDKKGITPLRKAAKVGHISLITFFLESDCRPSPDILEFPRLIQARSQLLAFDQWMDQEFGSPKSLRRCCRQVVRQCLSPNNTAHIKDLPVPSMVKDFLLGKHMELPFYRPNSQHILSFMPLL